MRLLRSGILRRGLLLAGVALLGVELAVLRADALELFRALSPSMVPALVPGDVFVADVRRTAAPPQPGDVVLFERERGVRPLYTKRVVATAGHWVALVGGRLFVDGVDRSLGAASPGGVHVERLGGHRYRVESTRGPRALDFGPLLVPAGHVFVLGDSRGRSVDSRVFGPVPLDAVQGRVLRILWSRDDRQHWRWQRLLTPLDHSAPHAAAPR